MRVGKCCFPQRRLQLR